MVATGEPGMIPIIVVVGTIDVTRAVAWAIAGATAARERFHDEHNNEDDNPNRY